MPGEKDQLTNINYFTTKEEARPTTPVERLAITLFLEMGISLLAHVPPKEIQSSIEERINEFLAQRDSQS